MKKFSRISFHAVIIIMLVAAASIGWTAGAQTAKIQAPPGFALPSRFTLVYRVTNTDVRSQLAKWTQYWDYRHQHFSDTFSRRFLKTAPPVTYTVTVSCRDGALYYQSTQGGMIHKAMYSPASQETVQCSGGQCWVYPYLQTGVMDHLPLPAASMGPLPFLLNPTAVTDVATPSGPVRRYVAQVASIAFGEAIAQGPAVPPHACTVDVENVGGTSKALNCVVFDYGTLRDRWDYYSHEKALGVMLPRLMTDLIYGVVYIGATANKPLPDTFYTPGHFVRRWEAANIYTYKLISVSPSPLSANYFTPEGIVKGGAAMAKEDPSTHIVAEFRYKVGGGSLDQQVQQAMWQMKVAQSQATDGKIGYTKHTSPLMLIGSVVCAACAWLVWRRRVARR
jgi:hypothetical protein